jgi:hypothetical protein
VEAVGILHDEFPGADESKARPDFIPELRLDLVMDRRQLLPGADRVTHDVRDHLLVCEAEEKGTIVPVAEREEHVYGIATRFLQILSRHQDGQVKLQPADVVHLFANDLRQLLVDTISERKVTIDASGQLAHEPATQQQPMADDFRICGDLPQCRKEVSRRPHFSSKSLDRTL